jgi:predicted dehydrogenase
MNDNQPQPDATRREFLKASTAAVVGGTLASGLLVPRSVHAAGDEVIKVGLIGCGGRGSGAAKNALAAPGPIKLVAMGDAFGFRLEGSLQSIQQHLRKENQLDRLDCPKERQFAGLDAYKKVIDCGVDMVILATPPGFRPQHFEYAINAGKHVFMEKPVAVDAPGVRQVLEATRLAKEKKLGVGVGLQRHHQNSYLETIQRLKDGAIGDIHTLRAYWNGAGVWTDRGRSSKRPGIVTEMQFQVDNWYYFTWLSGDHICEQHIHNLDVCNWVKGAYPVWAQGMGGREVRKDPDYAGEIFDHHCVEFLYADGARMFSFCRHIPGCWDSVSEHAQGTKGSADISRSLITVGNDQWKYRGPGNDPYQTEWDDLIASIRKGEPINEGEFGALSSMTAVMGRMATYSGKEVTWEKAFNSKMKLGPAEADFTWETTPPTPQVAVPGQTDAYLARVS